MASLKILISYSSIDKVLAGKLKMSLEQFGLTAFLAHNDIKPTHAWAEKILDELNKSEVFLPLLTQNFSKSVWTAQEVGMAIARDILIIPLKVDEDPTGFIGRIQALRLRVNKLNKSSNDIAQLISQHQPVQRNFLNGIIKIFEGSSAFDDATHNAKIINSFSGYSRAQVNVILLSAKDNYQIYHSYKACTELRRFIHKHKKLINQTTLKKLERRMI